MEGDVCDATADAVRAVRELDPLDLADRLLEIFLLAGRIVVSIV